MPIGPGTRLGPYEIISPLGAGGMGEVFRARDTRLQRDVAIKILPEALAADRDRRLRFEREAQAIAALNHPNILAIFDVGDGYIVTELLEGETLRARLAGGAVPARKAIEMASQMARGLAAAHDKGVVHRDLKPENVFVLADGQVKILDFGLARSVAPQAGASATVAALTDPGSALGTVGYMAPEQVRGQAVDGRADLFALGAVLYEMLAGRRAFQRDTAAETMTAILKEDPPEITGSRPELSPSLDRIVRHCLEKNPAERFQTARDVAFALEAFSGTHAGASGSGALATVGAPRSRARWALTALLVAAALAAGAGLDRALRPVPAGTSIAFDAKTWDAQWIPNARFAPDGQTIVFSAATTGNIPRLFVIRPGAVVSQPIGDAATHLLSISSTGELAVLTNARLMWHRVFQGTLARMTMDGAARPWMEDVTEADWSPADPSTLAIIRLVQGKSQLEYPVGTVLYQKPNGYLSDLRVSPDGSRVAFFDHQIAGDDRGWVKVVGRAGNVATLAGEYWGEEGLAWAADGQSVLYSATDAGGGYQTHRVNVSGPPVVTQAVPSAGAMIVYDVAKDGRALVTRDEFRVSVRALLPGESAEREFPWLDFAYDGYLSVDRKSLIFNDQSQSAGANYAVALRDIATGKVVRLGEGISAPPSPDGKWAPATIPSTGDLVLYPIGPGEPRKLARGPIAHHTSFGPVWSADGRRLLFCGTEQNSASRCYEQDIAGGSPKPITGEGPVNIRPAPDGRSYWVVTAGGEHRILAPGAAGTPVRGMSQEDFPLSWTTDGRALVVGSLSSVPFRVERVDPATGARTLLKELVPPDRAGAVGIQPSQWIDDGKGYVYTYFRRLSKLFVASGVR